MAHPKLEYEEIFSDRYNRQLLAHALLVELLSHQMAMPVRWIDTQDHLLSDSQNQRFIELGPSNTLTNMLKRTRDSIYRAMELSLGLDRKLLAASKDVADIHYDYVDTVSGDSAESSPKETEPLVIEPSSVTAAPSAVSVAAPAAPMITAEETAGPAASNTIEDIPVTQLDTILALVASKLKKPMSQILASSSLSELSLGKSALQNELIGDIDAEFEKIPAQPENMPISVLAEALPQRQDGDFGKPVSRLLSRWFSATMPNNFNAMTARDHLCQHWGLEKCRQSAVLLYACAQSTADGQTRIDAASEAKALLDRAVAEYAQRHGLSLQPVSSARASTALAHASTNISPEMLTELTEKPRQLLEAQKRILDEYLQADDPSTMGRDRSSDLELEQKRKLDLWMSEFGPDFEIGIQPKFSSVKVRHFNFGWNHARVELMKTYYSIAMALHSESGQESDFGMPSRNHLKKLADQCNDHALTLTNQLERDAEDKYGIDSLPATFARTMTGLVGQSLELGGPLCYLPEQEVATRPVTIISEKGEVMCKETSYDGERKYEDIVSEGMSRIRLLRKDTEDGLEEELLTTKLYESIKALVNNGVTFSGTTILLTGSGKGSIGLEITKGLLKGGATVVVTTSRDITEAQHFFQPVYAECGARGSELFVLPFNQGSINDCRGLINYIYDQLKLSIDVFIPLAAVPEQGIEISQLGEKSELAHRLMMSNVMRLLGMIVGKNPNAGRMTRVLLPLSPNHGTFGGDGLYSESKLGLESLMERVSSESWGDRVSMAGVRIGWTRGTGLMAANDAVAEAVESHGALTFTTSQMALNMLALLTSSVSELWDIEPVLADFSGGLKLIPDLKEKITRARELIRAESLTKQAVEAEDALESFFPPSEDHSGKQNNHQPTASPKRSRFRLPFPKLPDYTHDLAPLADLQGMVDPTDTIVIVGYSELGPWGSSRTRWEMECKQKFSQEGYIEMAWIMGLIKHDSKGGWIDVETGQHIEDHLIPARFGKQILQGSGMRLIHPESAQGYDPSKKEFLQEVVLEHDLPPFETDHEAAQAFQLKHGDKVVLSKVDTETCRVHIKAGACLMIPKAVPEVHTTVAGMLPDNWDPSRYGIPDDIVKQVDPITLYALICASEAFLSAGIDDPLEVFRHIHVSELGNFIGSSFTGLSKMRQIFLDTRLDKQVASDLVAEAMGNSPAAWINLLLLGASGPIKTPTGACATSLESLDGGVESIRAGKTRMCLVGGVDPFQEEESYAFATLKATVDADRQFAEGRQPSEMSRPSTETRGGFVDSAGGGALLICDAQLALNMGLPVYGIVAGTGMAGDKIGRSIPAPGQGLLTFAREDPVTRKSPVLDIHFRKQQMNAAIERLLYPRVLSRPATPNSGSSSSGPDLIWASESASAGQMSTSNSSRYSSPRPLKAVVLDDNEVHYAAILDPSKAVSILEGQQSTDLGIQAQIRSIRRQWSTGIRSLEPGLSPMRAALAVWGLDVNDISFASFHGTSTKANDINEAETVNQQMSHLGRDGLPMLVISQKSVTGHGKAAAASWMLNGCLQALETGVIPGNAVLDNIDPKLSRFEHLAYPAEAVTTGGSRMKAFLLSSFGFGQKGAQVIGVAPRYFFATLDKIAYKQYKDLCSKRMSVAHKSFAGRMLGNEVVKVHDAPPYRQEEEAAVLLDPYARAVHDETGQALFV